MFDQPEAEPDRLFVDPFACYNISPLQVGHSRIAWRVCTIAMGGGRLRDCLSMLHARHRSDVRRLTDGRLSLSPATCQPGMAAQ